MRLENPVGREAMKLCYACGRAFKSAQALYAHQTHKSWKNFRCRRLLRQLQEMRK